MPTERCSIDSTRYFSKPGDRDPLFHWDSMHYTFLVEILDTVIRNRRLLYIDVSFFRCAVELICFRESSVVSSGFLLPLMLRVVDLISKLAGHTENKNKNGTDWDSNREKD